VVSLPILIESTALALTFVRGCWDICVIVSLGFWFEIWLSCLEYLFSGVAQLAEEIDTPQSGYSRALKYSQTILLWEYL
jgi:hypothetical protein